MLFADFKPGGTSASCQAQAVKGLAVCAAVTWRIAGQQSNCPACCLTDGASHSLTPS